MGVLTLSLSGSGGVKMCTGQMHCGIMSGGISSGSRTDRTVTEPKPNTETSSPYISKSGGWHNSYLVLGDRSSLLWIALADKMAQVGAKVLIHERVDDRVGDVVGEVEIEHGHVPRQPVQGHEKPGGKGHDKHHRDDEKHRRRAQIGQERALRL